LHAFRDRPFAKSVLRFENGLLSLTWTSTKKQMKTQSEKIFKTSVNLHPVTRDFLAKLGKGVLSKGIEILATQARIQGIKS
jgi:hypothetical protein